MHERTILAPFFQSASFGTCAMIMCQVTEFRLVLMRVGNAANAPISMNP